MSDWQPTNELRWFKKQVYDNYHGDSNPLFKTVLQQKWTKGGELFRLSETEFRASNLEIDWRDVETVKG